MKRSILFVCTGNAGRSQMAEAMFRNRYGDHFEVYSAGVDPWPDLHPMAVRLMAEDGLDIAQQQPKHVELFARKPVDIAVTIGDRAEAETPDLSTTTRRIHWPIADPADADGTPDSEAVFRRTRAAILKRFPELVATLEPFVSQSAVGPQPAVSTCILRPSSPGAPGFVPERDLPKIADAGFRMIELCCYVDADFDWRCPAAVRKLRAVCSDLGIGVYSLHPPELGMIPESADRCQAGLETLKAFVDLALELGSHTVVFHIFPAQWSGHVGRLLDVLRDIEELVLDTPVTLCLETLQDHPSNEVLLQILPQTSRAAFGVVIDSGHCHIAGDLVGMPQQFGRRLKGLHIHDNDGNSDQHRTIGNGTIDWGRFAADLQQAHYEGPLMLEAGASPRGEDPQTLLRRSREALEGIQRHMMETARL